MPSMRPRLTFALTAWLPRHVICAMSAEADRVAPLETGGILLGYFASEARAVVVTEWLGPGPDAVHERSLFIPDQDYHLREIARRYAESGRRLEYAGDWHTHPHGLPSLSKTDRRTLKRIAAARHARSPRPLMCVLAPGPAWRATVWQGGLRGCLYRRLTVRSLDVRVYEHLHET